MARHLPDTDIIISTPFHPAYVTKDLISKASASAMLTAYLGRAKLGATHRLHTTLSMAMARCTSAMARSTSMTCAPRQRLKTNVVTSPERVPQRGMMRVQAPSLKLAITAGIGSDHVDLNAAAAAGLTVAEVTGTG